MSNRRSPHRCFAALFLVANLAIAQSLPLPPTVIVGGSLFTGWDGTYSSNNYNNGSASLTISPGGQVFFGSSSGYWSEPQLMSDGYWTVGYTSDGYWIYGYSTEGYYDENQNWVNGDWVPDVWVNGVWVDGYWVEPVWSDPVWNSTDSSESGSYARFTFQMTNGLVVQPADANGTAWGTVPHFGIPAVKVGNTLWQFNAADSALAYDYYSGPSDGSYLWVTTAYYGGYDSVIGSFFGTNSSGYFRDNSGTGALITPRNSNGTLLSIGSPDYGPWHIWSNGLLFRFMTTDATNGVDVYYEETSGFVYVYAPVGGPPEVSGLVNGTYANFRFQTTALPAFAAAYDGSPLPAGIAPAWGPPAVSVTNSKWRYRGSTSTADYYGGDRPGQMLSIDSNGAVFLSDRSLNLSLASGLYTGGVFQNLPVVVRGVKADGSAWSSRPLAGPNAALPESVLIDDRPWYYSSSQSTTNRPVYLGPQSGQRLSIVGTVVTLTDPTTSTNLTGTYAGGKFTFTGSTVSVKKGRADGTPFDAFGSLPTLLEGDVDITGQALSLGSWTNIPDNSGFVLSFQDGQISDTLPVSKVSFLATRQRTVWSWGHSNASLNATVEMMQLDADHRLHILPPPPSTAGPIVLDPVGTSRFGGRVRFDGPVRIAPQGDISMGSFTSEPVAP